MDEAYAPQMAFAEDAAGRAPEAVSPKRGSKAAASKLLGKRARVLPRFELWDRTKSRGLPRWAQGPLDRSQTRSGRLAHLVQGDVAFCPERSTWR